MKWTVWETSWVVAFLLSGLLAIHASYGLGHDAAACFPALSWRFFFGASVWYLFTGCLPFMWRMTPRLSRSPPLDLSSPIGITLTSALRPTAKWRMLGRVRFFLVTNWRLFTRFVIFLWVLSSLAVFVLGEQAMPSTNCSRLWLFLFIWFLCIGLALGIPSKSFHANLWFSVFLLSTLLLFLITGEVVVVEGAPGLHWYLLYMMFPSGGLFLLYWWLWYEEQKHKDPREGLQHPPMSWLNKGLMLIFLIGYIYLLFSQENAAPLD